MTRHLISRFHHVVVLAALLLTLATAGLIIHQGAQQAAALEAPAAIQVADGWDDPTGG